MGGDFCHLDLHFLVSCSGVQTRGTRIKSVKWYKWDESPKIGLSNLPSMGSDTVMGSRVQEELRMGKASPLIHKWKYWGQGWWEPVGSEGWMCHSSIETSSLPSRLTVEGHVPSIRHPHLSISTPKKRWHKFRNWNEALCGQWMGLLQWLNSKESTCTAGAARGTGSIPGWKRSPGERNGNRLQYSFLENPVDRGAWQASL